MTKCKNIEWSDVKIIWFSVKCYLSKVVFVQVLTSDPENVWRMVTIDDNKPRGLAPPFFQRILKTAWFHISILLLVLANAIVTATMHFDHYKIDPYQKIDEYFYTEV